MKINNYLDSTYLKTENQANLSEKETKQIITDLVQEAIDHDFVLVMIRPKFVSYAKEMISNANANVTVGTVIGFHEGTYSLNDKLAQAKQAIIDNVDDLDYVINYQAFINGDIDLVKKEVLEGTKIGLENNKIVKWIIEVAALNNEQIIAITKLINQVVTSNFDEKDFERVFVKSSTGFFKTENGKPAGATFEAMELITKYAKPLSAKAAGGVKTYADAVKMIEMGVTRIGTSSALKIFLDKPTNNEY